MPRFDPSGPLRGSLRPPADKSISHRAALIAAMGEGESVVGNYLEAADTRSTLDVIAAIGASVALRESRAGLELAIDGAGLRGASSAPVDVGNAGTLLRI